MGSYDAVIIGSGHNGLAAGIILARAGWKVIIVERNAEPGGAVRTAEVTLPGFRHDLFATNLNLFAGSAFFREFGADLRKQGLELVVADKPFGSVFPDGSFLGVSTDLEETVSGLRRISPADAEAWIALRREFERMADPLFSLLGCPMPSVAMARCLWKGMRQVGRKWPLELLHLVLQSPRAFLEDHFESPEAKALCAPWGLHLDFSPELAGGALFPFLESMAGHCHGMVLGKGGARTMIDAMLGLFLSLGGEFRHSCTVKSVLVEKNAAMGIELEDGERVPARRAVIANLTPTILFGKMIDAPLPPSFVKKVKRYRYGPGALMIHLALSDLPAWKAGNHLRHFAYVHIGPYLEDLSRTYQQALAGLLPDSPLLIVGQPTAVDPSRAPSGRHILWIQVRVVPSRVEGDASKEISGRSWDDIKEAYADRVVRKIEAYAPEFESSILARHVLSPLDLERANPNLIGGDTLGGSHHLAQNFLFRPFLGWSRYRTPVSRLFMCGASTWPGAGVGAGSGWLLGNMLVK